MLFRSVAEFRGDRICSLRQYWDELSVFDQLGCATFDADKIAHAVMEPGREAYADIVREFGPQVLAPDARIDRAKLGAIVFADADRRKRLNEIVHPRVHAAQGELLAEAQAANPDAIVIIDAALMIESGGYKKFDKLVVVSMCEVVLVLNANDLSNSLCLS